MTPPLWTLKNSSEAQADGLVVYIGGDGKPWLKNRPAANPDGKGVMAASLATLDARPAYFLGRPCYHWRELPEGCEQNWWTSDRFSRNTVDLLATTVRALQTREDAQQVSLVGYSGGGVLAILVADKLDAVDRVVTIAANLDTESWTQFHNLLALSESLNPTTDLAAPTRFEQVHLRGTNDRVVPASTTEPFRSAHPEAVFLDVEGFDHRCCWEDQWPAILNILDTDIDALRVYSSAETVVLESP